MGEVGELVITKPMPSMPLYFWGDEDGSRYREAYFDMYPGVWRHGDWIEITERGTAIITGRSDATINRGGIRMGTAEIYRAVLAVDAITDALVVDVPVEGEDAWMPLFVVLREGASLDDDVVAEIRKRVREDCSPRHVPSEVVQVARGPADAVGQGARAAGQADPDGDARREGRRARLAGEPGGAGRVRGARPRSRLRVGSGGSPLPLARASRQCRAVTTASSLRPTTRSSSSDTSRGDGRVLGLTRAGVWVLFVLAAANGLFLYFAPGLADTDYAWSIKPAVNASFIGAGFLAGTLATGLALRATRWRSFSLLPPALWVLATTLLAATIIHEDRFKWDYAPTWVWTFVYGFVPLAIPVLMLAPAARRRAAAAGRSAACVCCASCRACSAWRCSSAPSRSTWRRSTSASEWVWAVTPLLGRAVAAWYALFGTMLLTFAVGLRRPFEGLIGYATLACWSVLLLALPLVHSGDVCGEGWWVALMVALLGLVGVRAAARRGRSASRSNGSNEGGEVGLATARATALTRRTRESQFVLRKRRIARAPREADRTPSMLPFAGALRAVGGPPRARPLQRRDGLLARDRLAERRHRQLRRAHDGRALPDPLQGSVGLAAEDAREVHGSLAAAGAWAASLVRIPAARTATTAPTPQARFERRARWPGRRATAPATTAAIVAAARQSR